MRIVRSISIAAALALLAASSIAQTAPPQPPQSPTPPLVKEGTTVKISDHVYEIPDNKVGLVPNVGFVVGEKGVLIVDTGLGPRNMEVILKEAAKVAPKRDIYLVATHYHPEHAGGSSALPANGKFIAARIQQQDIEELGPGMMKQFSGMSPLNAELLNNVEFRKPDVLFDTDYTLDLGGVRVQLKALGPTHTRGDTIAFVEPDRVLFAGDIVMNKRFLAFSAQSSATAWLRVLDQLDALHATTIIPSHADIGDASLIAQQRKALQEIQARVKELKAQGKTADDVATTVTSEMQAKYPDWTTPNRAGAAARSFFEER